MPRLIFWDVDTQYDFMKQDGKLYVPDSEAIIGSLKALTTYAHQHDVPIVASADDHEPGHAELSDTPDFQTTFPPHCLRGTEGQRKIPETRLRDPLVIEPELQDAAALAERVRRHHGDILIHKHRFDVFSNPNTVTVLDALAPEEIVLYGVALDVCDRYAVEGLLTEWPQGRISVVTDAVRAIRPDEGERLLHEWSDRGVQLTRTRDITSEGLLEPLLAPRTIGYA